MKIYYIGHSCFLLETSAGTRVAVDPFDGIGWSMPRLRADCVCCTHRHFDHFFTDGVSDSRALIASAGEHVFEDLKIIGIPSFHDAERGVKRGENIVYKFCADGAEICHMGDIGEAPNAALLKNIGKVDALIIPVGGTYTVDASGALGYVRALRPRCVVPMHYKTGDCTLDIAPVDGFIALTGKENCVEAECLDTENIIGCEGKTILLRRWSDGR